MTAKQLLSVTHPELAKQAVGWDPSVISTFSHAKKEWKCQQGHVWVASISGRTAKQRGCPYCTNQKILPGYNDLETSNPDVALEAFGWSPKELSAGSGKRVQWKCRNGHVFTAAIEKRVRRGDGCPVCSHKQTVAGINDLATTDPVLAREAVGWDPSELPRSSNKRVPWKCNLGHVWNASPNNRTGSGTGCPYCRGTKVLSGFNDLATTFPDIAKEANGWNPSLVSQGSNKNVPWRCEFGHVWRVSINNRTKGSGCPVCGGTQLLSGSNDFRTKHPILAREAHEWNPSQFLSGSRKSANWKCEFGHLWKARIDSRVTGNGCPTCAFSGFDPNSEGWLYFLVHPKWEMLQIGITNFPDQRLKSHRKLGWELVELRGPMDGLIAREWETSILQMLKRRGTKFAPEEVAGKFDGYTEAWITESFPARSLKELMEFVHQDESSD